MLNDVTAGHPTSNADVASTLDEVCYLYERGNDEQAIHLIDVLIEGVRAYLPAGPDEIRSLIRALESISMEIEANKVDTEYSITELTKSLRAVA